jgi:hypothetical protein
LKTSSAVRRPRLKREDTDRFVRAVFDGLEVAERAYHHLEFSRPLVTALVSRAVRRAEPGDRVLLIGGSTLLAECLIELGFELEIWQFPNAHMTPAAKERVTGSIDEGVLADIDGPVGQYQLIIAPLVLETIEDGGGTFLRHLRKSLAADGSLIVATANQSRLEVRLAALAGRPMMTRRKGGEVSLGWPVLSIRSHLQRSDVHALASVAGYRVERSSYEVAWRPFLDMELLNVPEYGLRKLRQAVATAVGPYRDVIVAELSLRYADRAPMQTKEPTVSVFVSATRGGDHLRQTLDALAEQTYNRDLYEVVVLHDGELPGVSAATSMLANEGIGVREILSPGDDGPLRRNRAMLNGGLDISAHTDDSCVPPPDWIEAAARWFDEETAVITGPVFPLPGSEPRYMDVPSVRPDPGDKGVWSEVIYPASNVFYRTAVVLASGGFDTGFSSNGSGASVGWDTELAWRIQRSGWRGRFCEEVHQFRMFEAAADRAASLKDQMRRASELPRLAAKAPEFASGSFSSGIFAAKQTMYFDLALVAGGIALAGRNWKYLLLALPWLGEVNPRIDLWPPSAWHGSAATAGKIAMRQFAWLSGFVRGSIKARRLVL